MIARRRIRLVQKQKLVSDAWIGDNEELLRISSSQNKDLTMLLRHLLLGICIGLVSTCVAQDPFAGDKSNPFAGDKADPFAADANDPFGSDPFGAPPRNSKPPQRRTSRGDRHAAKDFEQGPVGAIEQKRVAPKSRTVHAKSAINEMLRTKLGEETTQTMINVPLSDFAQQISRSHDIPVVLDVRALEELGLSPDAPVTIDLRNVSLRSFLRLSLRGLDCTYLIRDEVLQITTLEAAEQDLIVKAYPIPDALLDRAEQLVEAIHTTVTPEVWDKMGGPCSMALIGDVMAVSATEDGHDHVVDFIAKVATAATRN